MQEWSFKGLTSVGARAAETARGAWRTGLCGCCAFPNSCVSVACCGQCATGQVASISVGGSARLCLAVTLTLLVLGVLGTVLQTVSVEAAVVFMVLSSMASCVVVFVVRRTVRKQQNIIGSDCEDCLLACCCSPCAICQLHNQRLERYRGPFATYDSLDEEEGLRVVS